MNNETKQLVPELRFPEFINDGEWQEMELGKIGNFIGGGTPDTTVEDYWDGDILWYTPTEVKEGNLNDSKRKITKKGLQNSSAKLLPAGTLLITTRATIGDIGIATIPCTTNQGFQSLVVNKNQVNTFWYYWLLSNKNELIRRSSGSTFREIGKNEITQITALAPAKLEQQKIADCLSTLDEVIAVQTEKLDALKVHKKGLMQNLFPQEGEKVPKLRFPEFRNDGEWKKNVLGKLGHFLGGGTPDRSNSDYWEGDIPWISSSDIGEDDIHNISITRFINDRAVKKSATKPIPKGSILFVSRVGVGKLAINGVDLCTSQDFTNFLPMGILNYFIAYYFLANKRLLESFNQGTSIKGFSKSDLENFGLPFPQNRKEQQKIANCLSSLDEMITAQTEKIEQLKRHKKGLIQGLFPVVN